MEILQVDKLNNVCRFVHRVLLGCIEAVLPKREPEEQTRNYFILKEKTFQR